MYNLGIYFFSLICRLASLFNKKIRTMCQGQKQTWHKISSLDKNKKTLWFHCASLGEFEQARNLIEALDKLNKTYNILISFFSPSGYEVRKNYKYADCVVYLPFDTPRNAKRFILAVNPEITFFIKYEFWWNYIRELRTRKLYSVSLILRKQHYLFKPYSFWFRKQLKNFDFFFVQNLDTATLLSSIGYKNNLIVGDTRFDRVFSMSKEQKVFPLIEKFIGGKNVFLAGSSWTEDEKIINEALKDFKEIKIIIAPHLIDKKHIVTLLNEFPNSITLSSITQDNCSSYNTLIIDNIGILMHLYSLCTIAYIGGGFGVGIHNILEAAVFNKPIAFGPNNKKFNEAQDLIKLGAAKEIHNAKELRFWIKMLLNDNIMYKNISTIAGNYVKENRGATDKILDKIFQYEEQYF